MMASQRKRTLSFCFDDGFRISARKIAGIFEARGQRATYCAIANPELTGNPSFPAEKLNDWGMWRAIHASGHEVAPHGLAHEHLNALSTNDAVHSLQKCFAIFAEQIPGFRSADTIFHAPYLSAPEPVLTWLSANCLGVRLGVPGQLANRWSDLERGGAIACQCFGPDQVMEQSIHYLSQASQEECWAILVFHGLDGEGWGPIKSADLDRLLGTAIDTGWSVEPANQVLRNYLCSTETASHPRT